MWRVTRTPTDSCAESRSRFVETKARSHELNDLRRDHGFPTARSAR